MRWSERGTRLDASCERLERRFESVGCVSSEEPLVVKGQVGGAIEGCGSLERAQRPFPIVVTVVVEAHALVSEGEIGVGLEGTLEMLTRRLEPGPEEKEVRLQRGSPRRSRVHAHGNARLAGLRKVSRDEPAKLVSPHVVPQSLLQLLQIAEASGRRFGSVGAVGDHADLVVEFREPRPVSSTIR